MCGLRAICFVLALAFITPWPPRLRQLSPGTIFNVSRLGLRFRVWSARFADMFQTQPDGRLGTDVSKLHEVERV